MVCKRCGGEINDSTGFCTACGSSNSSLIVHSLSELAERYGINPTEEEEKSEVPQLFSDYTNRTRFSSAVNGEPQEEKTESRGEPVLDMQAYAHLLGVDSGDDIEFNPTESAEKQSEETETEEIKQKQQVQSEETELNPLLQKIDKIIEKPADKILELYRRKYPRPARVSRSAAAERLMAVSAVMGAFAVVALLVVLIINSIAPDISGEWLVSETASNDRLTVEFTASGEVTSWIYIDEKANIYQQGSYKVNKSNGYNLLTITYEDGSQKKLYYNIKGDSGEFTNVDSGKSDTYTRLD